MWWRWLSMNLREDCISHFEITPHAIHTHYKNIVLGDSLKSLFNEITLQLCDWPQVCHLPYWKADFILKRILHEERESVTDLICYGIFQLMNFDPHKLLLKSEFFLLGFDLPDNDPRHLTNLASDITGRGQLKRTSFNSRLQCFKIIFVYMAALILWVQPRVLYRPRHGQLWGPSPISQNWGLL